MILILLAQVLAPTATAPQPIDALAWVTPADYAKPIAVAHDLDATRYVVSVDAQGKPFRCQITASSGVVRLDQLACAGVMVRGHFRPAIDDSGNAIASLYSGIQRWPIKGAAPDAVSDADLILNVDRLPSGATALEVGIRQIVRADGTTESCVVDSSSGVAALDRIACASAAPLLPPGPITDAKGAGLRAMRLVRLSFTTVQPAPQGTMWITVDDYPKDAIRRGEQGTTVMHWDISETGAVENCRIVQTSGSRLLDATSCDLITRRGRFTPAKDAAGKPIRSDATRSIRWKLPPRPDARIDDTLQQQVHAQDAQQQAIDRGSMGTPQ